MEPQLMGRVSTKYLAAMVFFMAGALVTTEGFRFLLAQGLQVQPMVNVGICVVLLAMSALVINRNNYWGDRQQHQLLMKLHLSGWQAIVALGVLVCWVGLKLLFFGASS